MVFVTVRLFVLSFLTWDFDHFSLHRCPKLVVTGEILVPASHIFLALAKILLLPVSHLLAAQKWAVSCVLDIVLVSAYIVSLLSN